MKEFISNKDFLKDSEIDKIITRVKVLMVNSKKELLLGFSYGTYQFPGGHLEEGEKLTSCIEREIQEETGLIIDTSNLEPFFLIKEYYKDIELNENKLYLIYYYVVNTNEKYKLSNTNYTKEEQDGNFILVYVKLDEVEELLVKSIPNNPKNSIIVKEMLMAINEYKKLLI